MADNVISNLSITVTSNADEVVRAFSRLASSARRLKDAAGGAASGMSKAADGIKEVSGSMNSAASSAKDMGTATKEAGEQAGKAQRNMRGLGNDAKDAGDKAKKGSSGIAVFWQSLKRIAFYRFIRSIIRGITDAFKTGITNLYHWSSAVNGTFAKSMDKIATSTLYLKNSLGAMLAPIIERLAPVIEWIIDRIVDVINWINKLFAALSGSQTYVVAKKVATTWADAGQSAATSAREAANEIKRTILGFDEINKLEKENKSYGGGSSATGTDGPNYSDMFEERRLDGWMSKLASFIDKFNLGTAGVIGGLIAGFAALKLAVKAVADLSWRWLKDMAGKTINIAVSLVRKGWETIKGWALSFGEAVVDLAVKIKTKALELWSQFSLAWTALNPVLKVAIVSSVTAAALWLAYKVAWALVPDKVLEVKAAISTTAAALKQKLIEAWGALGTWALGVRLSIITAASVLMAKVKASWEALGEWSLGVKLSLITSALTLKAKLVSAWNGLKSWYLGVRLGIITTMSALRMNIQNGWKKLGEWALGVRVSIITAAIALKTALQTAWAKLGEWSLGVKIRPEFDTGNASEQVAGQTWSQKAWNWIKDNWQTVAKGVLAVGVTIASPALAGSTLAGGEAAGALAGFSGYDPVYDGIDRFNQQRQLFQPGMVATGGGGGAERQDGLIGAGRGDRGKPTGDISALLKEQENAFSNSWNTIKDTVTKACGDMYFNMYQVMMNANKGDAVPRYLSDTNSAFTNGWETIKGTMKQAVGDMYFNLYQVMMNANRSDGVPRYLSETNDAFRQGWLTIGATVSSILASIQGNIEQRLNAIATQTYNKFRSVANSVISLTNGMIGKVESGINSAIKGINKALQIRVNIQVPAWAGGGRMWWNWSPNLSGVSLGRINALAKGGILKDTTWLNGSTLAGENGAEAVLPLERNTEWMDTLASRIYDYSAMQTDGMNDGDYEQVAIMRTMLSEMRSMLVEMRRLNEKEFTAEVTTAGIQRAMARTNRRAGIAVTSAGV